MQLLQSHRENHLGLWRHAYQQQSRRDCWSPKQRITAVVCISCRDTTKNWRVRKEAVAADFFFLLLKDHAGRWVLAILDKDTTVLS